MPATLFRARLETRNFEFEAFGETDGDARAALVDGLHAHARQYAIAATWWHPDADAITVQPIRLGFGYRDREMI